MKYLQILVKDIIFLHFLFFTTGNLDMKWYADTNNPGKLECNHSLKKGDIITWQKNNTQIVYKADAETKITEGYDLEVEHGKVYLIINKVKKVDGGNYSCTVFNKDQANEYRTISGYLQVRGLSHRIRSSLSALLVGCLLQVVLHGL